MNPAHKITYENNEQQVKETFKCYSALYQAETVVTIYKHKSRHHNQHTHTVPTVIGGGPSLSLKWYTYKTAGGCSLMSYPEPVFG